MQAVCKGQEIEKKQAHFVGGCLAATDRNRLNTHFIFGDHELMPAWNRRTIAAICVALSLSFMIVAPVSAIRIEIEFTGLDIQYDSTSQQITDSDLNGDNPGTLTSLVFQVVGEEPVIFTSDLTADLEINNVSPIASGGGSATASDGHLNVDFDGWFLDVDLENAIDIVYDEINGSFGFVFLAGVGSMNAESLPGGLHASDPMTVSFSTQVSSLVDNGQVIESFVAMGTGEVVSDPTPEPATLTLLALAGGLATGLARHRS